MFDLFTSTRKKAIQGAVDAMRPMIGCLQGLGGPGVPAGMWHDPYILGFTHRSIGAWAQFATGFKTKPMDLGFALMATYTAISSMNGNELANAASELAVAKDPEFERGAENATTYFLYCHGMLKDGDDKRGLVRKATEKAKTTSRDAITATMLTEIWINEVKRVEAKYNR